MCSDLRFASPPKNHDFAFFFSVGFVFGPISNIGFSKKAIFVSAKFANDIAKENSIAISFPQ